MKAEYLLEDEKDELVARTEGSHELGIRSTICWIWIAEMMSRVRAQPEVPPPMYVRLLSLCHDCMKQTEELKTNLTVQIPFMYAHMLSVLVHLSNCLLAVSCGLALGSALAEITDRSRQLHKDSSSHLVKEFYEAIQVMGMQIITLLIQPVLYQARIQARTALGLLFFSLRFPSSSLKVSLF